MSVCVPPAPIFFIETYFIFPSPPSWSLYWRLLSQKSQLILNYLPFLPGSTMVILKRWGSRLEIVFFGFLFCTFGKLWQYPKPPPPPYCLFFVFGVWDYSVHESCFFANILIEIYFVLPPRFLATECLSRTRPGAKLAFMIAMWGGCQYSVH